MRCASGSSLECCVEDVCDARHLSELASRIFGVKQIDCDMPVTLSVRRLASRQPHHLPIGLLNEPLGDVAPDDTKCSDNDSLILHTLSCRADCEAGPNDRYFE